MTSSCVHSCKGLCSALEAAEQKEKVMLGEYREFAARCDYPEVRVILENLVAERERGLKFLQEQRRILTVKFETIDKINESFA